MIVLVVGCLIFAAVCGLSLVLMRVAERQAMKSLHQPLARHTGYVRYMRDKHELNGLGFAQQLSRESGGMGAFGLSLSGFPLIGCAIFMLGPAVAAGGPAVIGLGWPLLGFFGLLTACSLATFASALPTAGGCYHWALVDGNRRSALWSGWLHIAGTTVLLAATNVWLADWISRTIDVHFGYTGGAKLFVIVLIMVFVTQTSVNVRSFRSLGIRGIWTFAISAFMVAALLLVMAYRAWPGDYPFQIMGATAEPWLTGGFGTGGNASFLLGLLLMQRVFLGAGDGAQAGEEIRDPRINMPWGIYLSTAAVIMFGYLLYAFILLFGAHGAEDWSWTSAIGDWLVTMWSSWGAACSAVFCILASLLAWANGASSMSAASRTLFAMARDDATPFPEKLSFVSEQYRSPANAVVTIGALSGATALLLALLTARNALTSNLEQLVLFGVIAIHAAYAIPVGKRFYEQVGWIRPGQRNIGVRSRPIGPWHLGRFALAVDGTVFCWLLASAGIAVCLLEPHTLAFAASILLVAMIGIEWQYRAARRKMPVKVVGSSRFGRRTAEECMRIERKFPQQF